MPETSSKSTDKPVSKASSHSNPVAPVVLSVILSAMFGFLGGWFAVENLQSDTVFLGGEGEQVVLNESNLVAEIAERVSPSVVSINVTSNEVSSSLFFGERVFERDSEGSGIILSENGLVVTNKHVIPENATDLSIVLADGTEYDDIDIVGRDPFNDIAFLRINDASDLKPATLGDSSSVRVGEKVVAIGNALGEFESTVTSGIISGLSRPILAGDGLDVEQLQDLFQTDAAINPGNSGGPLLNASGQVIGINTAVAGGGQNIGFAIPINQVKPGITSIQQNNRLVRPYLGVRYVMLDGIADGEFDTEATSGALVIASGNQAPILAGSPAEKAGIRERDVILKVEDTDINEDNPLVTTVSQHQVGETIELTIQRDGENITLEVTLEEVPDNL